jgi:hypothetical protein
MFWRIHNLISPQTPTEMNRWFIPNSIGYVFASCAMQFGLALVILLRTLKMYNSEKKHWFRIYTIIMTTIIGIGSAMYSVTGTILFGAGVDYAQHPMYRIALFSGGFLMNFNSAIHMTISAFVFLHKIYSSRGFTLQEFLKDWILKQDGFRYILVLGINSFLLYCYGRSAIYGQDDNTVLMFYFVIWVASACLMTFMENSYTTTKSIIKNTSLRVGTGQTSTHVAEVKSP